MEEKLYYIWFSKTELNAKEKIDLIKKHKIEDIWNMDKDQLFELLKDNTKVERILDKTKRTNLDKHLDFIAKNNIKVIDDKKYFEGDKK